MVQKIISGAKPGQKDVEVDRLDAIIRIAEKRGCSGSIRSPELEGIVYGDQIFV